MNVKDFTYFLENPTKVVEPIHTKHLEDIIAEYPYFQAARALHLKGLKNLNSYKYNKALKTPQTVQLGTQVSELGSVNVKGTGSLHLGTSHLMESKVNPGNPGNLERES